MRFLPLVLCCLPLALCMVGCADPEVLDEPVAPTAIGSCDYVNSFSDAAECKEYVGEGWTTATAEADCATPMPGAEGSFTAGQACDRTSTLGECFIEDGEPLASNLVFPGQAGDSCDGLELGCSFAGGEYSASELCDDEGGGPVQSSVFIPFEQICVEPLDGQPGAGPEGDVCTWQAISGSTEEGRKFTDYADCEIVRTQRPYWANPTPIDTNPDDPRLSDEAYLQELGWVTSQVEASACICCHSGDEASGGASGWAIDAGPLWVDSLDDDGAAMMGGWVDSSVFGAFDAEDNNGFDRSETGLPTTDPDRMRAFWEAELTRRGKVVRDFVDTEPFGGPLYDQLVYAPEACDSGAGIDRDGRISWTGGAARYLYVMEPGSAAPGVPPNLDRPQGTLWRLDVQWTAEALSSGVVYGQTGPDTFQTVPEAGPAPALTSGQSYYLYVLADVYQPLERCVFQMP